MGEIVLGGQGQYGEGGSVQGGHGLACKNLQKINPNPTPNKEAGRNKAERVRNISKYIKYNQAL